MKYLIFIILIISCISCENNIFNDIKVKELNELIQKSDQSKANEYFKVNPKIDLNAANNKEETLLELAIMRNDYKAFEWLLKNGANPNFLTQERSLSAMKLASEHKEPKYLELLLSYKGDPNLFHKLGYNPLYFAAVSGLEKNIDVLKSNGGDPFLENKYHDSTFLCLLIGRKYKGVNLLLHSGFNIPITNREYLFTVVVLVEKDYGELPPELNEEYLKFVNYLRSKGIEIRFMTSQEKQRIFNTKGVQKNIYQD